jgi:glycosyltransferase involved in cell wall biosynthesis
MNPLVSVVMPLLNGDPKHLRQSIESILNQTFSDFEYIIIDDGCDEKTKSILANYSKADSRIILLTNPVNEGVGFSLDRGLKEAKGVFFARHDSDDISLPNRLAVVVDYLQKMPHLAICGSDVDYIDMNGNLVGSHPISSTPDLLKAELLLNSRICTPSTVARTSALRDVGGVPHVRNAEDYLLFLRLIENGFSFGGINQRLLRYRINYNSLTRKYRSEQLCIAMNGSYEHACKLLGVIDKQAFERFWLAVANKGINNMHLFDLLKIQKLLNFIKNNPNYAKAWGGILKWVFRTGLNEKFSIKNLLIAIYFRTYFRQF